MHIVDTFPPARGVLYHEIGHMVMCYHYGVKPYEIMFELGMSPMNISEPVVKQDDIVRIEQAFAGPLSQLSFLPESVIPPLLRCVMEESIVFHSTRPL